MTGSVAAGIVRIIRDKGFVQGIIAQKAGFTNHQLCDMLKGHKIIRGDYLVGICAAPVSHPSGERSGHIRWLVYRFFIGFHSSL